MTGCKAPFSWRRLSDRDRERRGGRKEREGEGGETFKECSSFSFKAQEDKGNAARSHWPPLERCDGREAEKTSPESGDAAVS